MQVIGREPILSARASAARTCTWSHGCPCTSANSPGHQCRAAGIAYRQSQACRRQSQTRGRRWSRHAPGSAEPDRDKRTAGEQEGREAPWVTPSITSKKGTFCGIHDTAICRQIRHSSIVQDGGLGLFLPVDLSASASSGALLFATGAGGNHGCSGPTSLPIENSTTFLTLSQNLAGPHEVVRG